MAKHSISSKQQEIADLRTLLQAGEVTTQEGLCGALAEAGHEVTQSKVSRLLRKIGAVKTKNEAGQVVYRLPREPAPPTMDSELASLVIDVVANEALIMVTTSPGAAQLVARVLDYHKEPLKLLGAIAGDDAIFVAPQSVKEIAATLKAVKACLSVS